MVKDGFQQTEIGKIPDDWTIKKIKEFTDATSGGTPSTSHSEYWNGKIRWMNSGEINLKKIYEVKGRITELGLKNSSTKLIPKNCILIALAGQGKTRGTVAINYVESCINQSLGVILPNKSFSSEYVYHNLDSRYDELRSLSSGGEGRGGLNLTLIKNIRIQFPPTITEQNLIVKVLDCMDQIIEKIKSLIEKKKNIKQGAMQELLTGKRRLDGFTKKWEVKALENITNCLDNLRIPLNDSQRQKMRGDYPYCGANDVLDYVNDYVINDEFILIAEDGGHFDEYEFRPIAYKMNGKCWVNNHAHILKAKEGFSQDFIFYSLVHKNILRFLAGGTRAKLNKSEMYKIEIDIPTDLIEQTTIAQTLLDIEVEIKELEFQRNKYNMIKEGMMQKLLTGEIRLV